MVRRTADRPVPAADRRGNAEAPATATWQVTGASASGGGRRSRGEDQAETVSTPAAGAGTEGVSMSAIAATQRMTWFE
ncbi:hypothetical protein GCM10009755_15210 [Brevibacterium samyangense]|uniref:Uncharacterized protein n=1 Tax=Brevibacterium samyangense TaxID=366888 RepID=A0ABP5ERZ0_9MICO